MRRAIAAFVVCTLAATALVAAQQAGRQGGGQGGGVLAPPPIIWPAPPLPDGPITAETAEPAHRRIRIVVTKGLSHRGGWRFCPMAPFS